MVVSKNVLIAAGIIWIALCLSAFQTTGAADDDLELCNHSLVNPDAGIPACTRLIDSAKDKASLSDFYNNRGVARIQKGDLESAIKDFTSVLDRNPNSIDAFKNRGLAHQIQGDYEGALADYNRAIRLDKKTPSLFNARGTALFGMEQYDLAIADYDKAIKLDGKFANAFYNRGQARYLKRHFDRSIADFDEFIKLTPNDPKGYIQRADARIQRGDSEGAIRDYDAAIEVDPKNNEAYSHRGEAYRLLGELGKSITDHDNAIELNATPEAYVNRALVLADQGKLSAAIADCDEAILLKPRYDLAYATRGKIRRLAGDINGSLNDLNKALTLNPHSVVGLSFRGDTYRARGEAQRAITDLDEALRLTPDFVAAYVSRGQAYEMMGAIAKAKADFEQAIKLPNTVDGGLVKPAQETARARLADLAKMEERKVKSAERLALKNEGDVHAQKVAEASSKETVEPVAKLVPAAIAPVENRVALVIGNSNYREVTALPNPRRDADAVASALRQVGFKTVQIEHDLTREKFINALRVFAEKVETADWAVIYYAGHGLEIGGVNYLVPTDAKLRSDRDVQDEAVTLERVLFTTEVAKKLRLIILDACRDNPFLVRMQKTMASRSIGRGLARVEPDRGTLVVYSARDGQVAQDGDGQHSPFTQAFLDNVVKPKLEIDMMFRRVRDEVITATNSRQEPFKYGSLPGDDFYFIAK
ncbi:tetratricopeptide repeat protein [Beijerinckia mobilis]|uniref:tetratricopeptide repeat protein n=1 Tax=Beijerinckia mobilis TaxID=231434 RepID=UPI00069009BF|nr:tetratricopeptide repeat protein [Beijerinckia mobilis]